MNFIMIGLLLRETDSVFIWTCRPILFS